MAKFCTARPEISKDSIAKVSRAIEAIREARMLTVTNFLKEIGWSSGTYYNILQGRGISQMSVWQARVWLRKWQGELSKSTEAITHVSDSEEAA